MKEMKVGPRAIDDPLNIEGSGYGYNDAVTVDHCGEDETKGRVHAIHTGGKKLDITISHPGHKEHGRTVTFNTDDVTPLVEKKPKTVSA